MTLGVDQFKSAIKGGGARSNLFRVKLAFPNIADIDRPDAENVTFMIKAASLPESTLGSFVVNYRGREFKMAGDRTFAPWTTTIINDTDFSIRNALEQWSNSIQAHRLNTGIQNPNFYMSNLVVEQLDRDERVIKRVEFVDAFPENIAPITLSYDNRNEIETFDCTWAYQYWQDVKTTDSRPGGILGFS